MEALHSPGLLTVLIDKSPIGTVTVTERYTHKIFGTFTPTTGFDRHRTVFEAALELARQFDALVAAYEPCDDMLWSRLMTAYSNINRLGPVFAELPGRIEEFAIGPDWSVEITFEVAPAEPDSAPDRTE